MLVGGVGRAVPAGLEADVELADPAASRPRLQPAPGPTAGRRPALQHVADDRPVGDLAGARVEVPQLPDRVSGREPGGGSPLAPVDRRGAELAQRARVPGAEVDELHRHAVLRPGQHAVGALRRAPRGLAEHVDGAVHRTVGLDLVAADELRAHEPGRAGRATRFGVAVGVTGPSPSSPSRASDTTTPITEAATVATSHLPRRPQMRPPAPRSVL